MPAPVTSLKLDPVTEERVQRLASARHTSAYWILREAVEQYLEQEEKRERLRHDAQTAWEHFQATGLHTTAEETDAWLTRLEAGEDAAPPPCHV